MFQTHAEPANDAWFCVSDIQTISNHDKNKYYYTAQYSHLTALNPENNETTVELMNSAYRLFKNNVYDIMSNYLIQENRNIFCSMKICTLENNVMYICNKINLGINDSVNNEIDGGDIESNSDTNSDVDSDVDLYVDLDKEDEIDKYNDQTYRYTILEPEPNPDSDSDSDLESELDPERVEVNPNPITKEIYEYSTVRFMVIEYENPAMKTRIELELPREWLVTGNDLLTPVHIMHMLEHQSEPYIFDFDYKIHIMDTNFKTYYVDKTSYIHLNKNNYKIRYLYK